jgi:hypothetical protein
MKGRKLAVQRQIVENKNTSSVVAEKYADETLRIVEEHGKELAPLSPDEEKALRRKCYLHVVGLLSVIICLLFVSARLRSLNEQR